MSRNMQKLNPISSPSPEKQGKKEATPIGIANFSDSTSRYSSERLLYDASTLRPHPHFDNHSGKQERPLEGVHKDIWGRLMKEKGHFLQIIGLCLKYLVLAIIFPIYFCLYLVPINVAHYLKQGLGYVKKGLDSAEQWFLKSLRSFHAKFPTRNTIARWLQIPRIVNTAKAISKKMEHFKIRLVNIVKPIFVKTKEKVLWLKSKITACFQRVNTLIEGLEKSVLNWIGSIKTLSQRLSGKFTETRTSMQNFKGKLTLLNKQSLKEKGRKHKETIQETYSKVMASIQSRLQQLSNRVDTILDRPVQAFYKYIHSPLQHFWSNVCEWFRKKSQTVDRTIDTHFMKIKTQTSHQFQSTRETIALKSSTLQTSMKSGISIIFKPISALSEVIEKTGASLQRLFNRTKEGIQKIRIAVGQSQEFLRSAPNKIKVSVTTAWENRVSLRERGRLALAWGRMLPRYAMHLFDEVVAEMVKASKDLKKKVDSSQ